MVRGTPTTILEESYRLVMQCKGTCYLPWDPLAHMLAGDIFRPNMDVINSYSLGGHPVDQKAFAAALPEKLSHIYMPIYATVWGLEELRRLSQFHHQAWHATTEGKSGDIFVVLTAKSSAKLNSTDQEKSASGHPEASHSQ